MTIGIMTNRSAAVQPLFSASVLWAIRVLAWLAFLITSYLAYKSIGHGVASSCITGSADCEAVQSSIWSVWLGLPVAALGLACYSSLATLSLLTGLSNPRALHWVGTAIVLLSLVAALSGLWFIGLQFFALGKICIECMAVHICGLSIAGLVLWNVFRKAPARSAAAATRGSASSLMALRAAIPNASSAAMPAANRASLATAPVRAVPSLMYAQTRPSLTFAFSGAIALLTLLIAGQVLLPASGSTQERLALAKPINLDDGTDGSTDSTSDKQAHVVKKISTDVPENDPGVKTVSNDQEQKTGGNDLFPTPAPGSDATAKNDAANVPLKKRLVSFLDGTLSLDVYRRPVLGSREAPNFVLEFVSYDCPHCHHMHRLMRRALDRYGDQVSVVVMVIPMGIECNKEIKEADKSKTGACKTAEMAIDVSALDPDRFAKFHDWLMEGKDAPPSPAQVVQKAYNFVGRDRIMSLSKADFQKQVDQNIDLYNKIQTQRGVDLKKGGLPLVIVGKTVNSGTPANEEKFIQLWEDEFGIKPVGSTTTAGL